MKKKTCNGIKKILLDTVKRTIKRISENKSYRPFHEALLSKEVIKASTFERSFSTSFGQGSIERISELVAQDAGYETTKQKETLANLYKGAIDQIDRIMRQLRDGTSSPNWKREIARIIAVNKGDTDVVRVISDLYMKKGKEEVFISIKTVKPNLDQTEIAKRNMLMLKAHNPSYKTYFGLYYNPGGENRGDYNWKVPSSIFDMHRDECVLIGVDYWDTIGGNGTYTDLCNIFKEVGNETREKLKELTAYNFIYT